MKRLVIKFAALCLFCGSCATISSKSVYSISVNTIPHGANIKVLDRKGKQIILSQGPDTFKLRASHGYFRRAEYTIESSLEGYLTTIEPLYFTLDKKYIDNIYFLHFMPIGLLLIDPVSGAMWMPERQSVEIVLKPSNTD